MRAAKRDKNEKELIEAWRACGAVWIPMGQDAGFDGLLVHHGEIHIVEVKDVSDTNGRFTLTANELTTKDLVELIGEARYNIVTNIDEALRLVGAK